MANRKSRNKRQSGPRKALDIVSNLSPGRRKALAVVMLLVCAGFVVDEDLLRDMESPDSVDQTGVHSKWDRLIDNPGEFTLDSDPQDSSDRASVAENSTSDSDGSFSLQIPHGDSRQTKPAGTSRSSFGGLDSPTESHSSFPAVSYTPARTSDFSRTPSEAPVIRFTGTIYPNP